MKLKPLRYADDTENVKKYILIGSLVIALIAVILIMELRNTAAPTDRYEAYAAAQNFVEKTLKNPESADFQSVNQAEIEGSDNNIWRINSFVDYKEESGNTVRSFFTMQIKYDGSEWTLMRLNFTGKKDL